jgi:hypothetical protein
VCGAYDVRNGGYGEVSECACVPHAESGPARAERHKGEYVPLFALSVEYGFSACCDESPTSREVSEIKKLLSSSEFGNHFWARPPRRFGDGTLPDSVQDDFFEEAAQSCFAAASAICLSIRCNTESSLIGYSSFFIWCSPGEI